MTVECDDSLVRLRDLLVPIRASIEDVVYSPGGSALESVTGLLSAVPAELCERVGHAWADLAHRVPVGELRGRFSHEDRLLIDIVLSMTDDRRSFESIDLAGVERVR